MKPDIYWEMQKIAGCDEYNHQIDERRRREEEDERNQARIQAVNLVSEELRHSNELTKKQADDATQSSRKATRLSILSLAISSLLSIGSLIVSIIALCKG